MNSQRYETKPLECWPKMKELRRKYFWHIWESNKRGDPLVIGVGPSITITSILAGLGDPGVFGVGPYLARMLREPNLAVQSHEATEARGFGRDICATLRLSLGSRYLDFHDKSPTGERVKPDFCLELLMCEAQSKTVQWFAEEYNIPHFTVELVSTPPGHDRSFATEYLVRQMDECIDWMAQVTKREYDDSRLIEAVYNEWESSKLWAQVCELNKAVPATLDVRALTSFQVMMMVTGKHRQDTVAFFRTLRDEVEDRVKKGISAIGVETCRLMHEGQPPYFFRPFLKYPNQYGAVYIGSRFLFSQFGSFIVTDDGRWVVPQTPRERGIELKTREDALRSLAELYMDYSPIVADMLLPSKVQNLVNTAREWNAQGVVLHLDRGCRAITAGEMEARMDLQKNGIPTMVYEGSNCDPREFSPAEVLDRLDSFLESLGLTKVAS